ncbi:hypothetical protein T484DRAFT_1742344 [Baffinella frigidus]|nr:hypothetical protein T484DRAFT_1742344 [Cryptophyta sp. CCMP2293]
MIAPMSAPSVCAFATPVLSSLFPARSCVSGVAVGMLKGDHGVPRGIQGRRRPGECTGWPCVGCYPGGRTLWHDRSQVAVRAGPPSPPFPLNIERQPAAENGRTPTEPFKKYMANRDKIRVPEMDFNEAREAGLIAEYSTNS